MRPYWVVHITHFWKTLFESILPKSVKIISSAIETVRDVEQTLLVNGTRNISGNDALPVFYTTGLPERFS